MLQEKIQNLSKPVKTAIVAGVVWTSWVIYRTSDYHELLGYDLDRWDNDQFLTNLFSVPLLVVVGIYAYRWISKDRKEPTKMNPLTEFEKEIQTWPANQGKIALLLLKAVLSGDSKKIDELYGDLTVEQFRKVKEVVEKIERSSNR